MKLFITGASGFVGGAGVVLHRAAYVEAWGPTDTTLLPAIEAMYSAWGAPPLTRHAAMAMSRNPCSATPFHRSTGDGSSIASGWLVVSSGHRIAE